MKRKRLEQSWVCQLCGKCWDEPKHHANTHKHKMNLKKLEDAQAGEVIRKEPDARRWWQP